MIFEKQPKMFFGGRIVSPFDIVFRRRTSDVIPLSVTSEKISETSSLSFSNDSFDEEVSNCRYINISEKSIFLTISSNANIQTKADSHIARGVFSGKTSSPLNEGKR